MSSSNGYSPYRRVSWKSSWAKCRPLTSRWMLKVSPTSWARLNSINSWSSSWRRSFEDTRKGWNQWAVNPSSRVILRKLLMNVTTSCNSAGWMQQNNLRRSSSLNKWIRTWSSTWKLSRMLPQHSSKVCGRDTISERSLQTIKLMQWNVRSKHQSLNSKMKSRRQRILR